LYTVILDIHIHTEMMMEIGGKYIECSKKDSEY